MWPNTLAERPNNIRVAHYDSHPIVKNVECFHPHSLAYKDEGLYLLYGRTGLVSNPLACERQVRCDYLSTVHLFDR